MYENSPQNLVHIRDGDGSSEASAEGNRPHFRNYPRALINQCLPNDDIKKNRKP